MEDPRLYVRTANEVRAQIEDGSLKPGDHVPSITALSQQTGRSRQTIGKALQRLERDGLLRRVQGRGYFVSDRTHRVPRLPAPERQVIAGQIPAQTAGDLWEAALYRCPCGHTADDAEEFGRHLEATAGLKPEHFEVLDGWTLQQVRQWQAFAAGVPAHGHEAMGPVHGRETQT
jgi:DNA-binding transcriptional regulator YhcF (GntR family)